MTPARGRPRRQGPSVSGLGTEEDVLLAAASLFCEIGYGSTSTYAIARRAGVSQASIYHYFPGKHAILLGLLLRTVRSSLTIAEALLERPGTDPVARLWSLCEADVRLLASGSDNTGELYLLPELHGPGSARFAAFHEQRDRLRGVYRQLVGAVLLRSDPGAGAADVDAATATVFGLVESVVLRRREEPDLDPAAVAALLADAVLRVLRVDEPRLSLARDAARSPQALSATV